jgi:CxxC-x17-CxxC domain-containing protein
MGYGNFRGGGSSGGSSGGFGGRRPGGFRRSFGGPREMTKIKCAKCGKDDEVPFKPRDGSTVLCKDCYFKEKGITPRAGGFNSEAPKKEAKADGFEESEPQDSEEFGEEAA